MHFVRGKQLKTVTASAVIPETWQGVQERGDEMSDTDGSKSPEPKRASAAATALTPVDIEKLLRYFRILLEWDHWLAMTQPMDVAA